MNTCSAGSVKLSPVVAWALWRLGSKAGGTALPGHQGHDEGRVDGAPPDR